ncbi:MAG: hypothetical protein ABIA76_06155 [Candidatus Diapherotrites archaeon]
MKQKLILICFFLLILFFTACFDSENPPKEVSIKLIGFMGVSAETDFFKVKELGAEVIGLANAVSPQNLHAAVINSESLDLKLGARAEGQEKFNTSDNKLDFLKLKQLIPAEQNLAFYYVIDEPCHKDKINFSLEEFKFLYFSVKEINPDIPVLVNFGALACLESFIPEDCSEWKIADIAFFTLTEKK